MRGLALQSGIGDAVAFLGSDPAGLVTGRALLVAGGRPAVIRPPAP